MSGNGNTAWASRSQVCSAAHSAGQYDARSLKPRRLPAYVGNGNVDAVEAYHQGYEVGLHLGLSPVAENELAKGWAKDQREWERSDKRLVHYRGTAGNGRSVVGAETVTTPAAFVKARFNDGYQWLEVSPTRGFERIIGTITDNDEGERIWWAER